MLRFVKGFVKHIAGDQVLHSRAMAARGRISRHKLTRLHGQKAVPGSSGAPNKGQHSIAQYRVSYKSSGFSQDPDACRKHHGCWFCKIKVHRTELLYGGWTGTPWGMKVTHLQGDERPQHRRSTVGEGKRSTTVVPRAARRKRKACFVHIRKSQGFDSTLGFPGEGPKEEYLLYFANITSWSDKAVDYLLHTKDSPPALSEIICLAEHHLVQDKLKSPRRKIDKAGRYSFVTAATSTGLGGSSGGTMVLPRNGLHISKVWSPEGGPMNNWSACMIRGSARDLIVISIYLKDGEGMSHVNLARLSQVHDLIKSTKVPWIILGDFNMNPRVLEQGGLLELVGGTIITANEGALTCTTGKGGLLDFAIARKDIAETVTVSQDLKAPWSPHVGLKVSIHIGPWKDKVWKWANPRNLPEGRPFGPHNQTSCTTRIFDPMGTTGALRAHKVWGREGNCWAPGASKVCSKGPGKSSQTPSDREDLPKSAQANSQELTVKYQAWSALAETHILSTWSLSAEEVEASQGRAPPLRLC
jgi:hypothetical protein